MYLIKNSIILVNDSPSVPISEGYIAIFPLFDTMAAGWMSLLESFSQSPLTLMDWYFTADILQNRGENITIL